MADDVNVKQSALLHAYAGKVNDFRDVTVAGSLFIHHQARKYIEQYKEVLHDIGRDVESAEDMARSVVSRYDFAFQHDLPDDARDVIGHSDEEAKKKLDDIHDAYEQLSKTIRDMETKLVNIREKTKTYGSQMNEMCERSSSMLKQRADLIDLYKERK